MCPKIRWDGWKIFGWETKQGLRLDVYLFPVIILCYFLAPLHCRPIGPWQTIIFIIYYFLYFLCLFPCHFNMRQCWTSDWKKNNYINLERTVLHIYTNVIGWPPFLNYLFPIILTCINEEQQIKIEQLYWFWMNNVRHLY